MPTSNCWMCVYSIFCIQKNKYIVPRQYNDSSFNVLIQTIKYMHFFCIVLFSRPWLLDEAEGDESEMARRTTGQIWQDRKNHHYHSCTGLQSRREMGMSVPQRHASGCQIKSLLRRQEAPDTAETRLREGNSASGRQRTSLWNGGMRHPGSRLIAVLLPTPDHNLVRVLRDVPAFLHHRRPFRHHRLAHARPRASVPAARETSSFAGGRHAGGTDVNFHATPEMVPGTRHGRHQDLPGSGIYPAPMFQKRCERGIGRSKSRRQRPQQSHHSRH